MAFGLPRFLLTGWPVPLPITATFIESFSARKDWPARSD